jgi:hypothetical protein
MVSYGAMLPAPKNQDAMNAIAQREFVDRIHAFNKAFPVGSVPVDCWHCAVMCDKRKNDHVCRDWRA